MMDELPEVFTRRLRTPEEHDAARREGGQAFLRADQEERLRLTKRLVTAHLNGEDVNDGAVAGALREAWHSEPCIGGCRFGSYLSAVEEMEPGNSCWSLGEIALERGEDMMDFAERVRFEKLEFPLMVHRGGIGDVALVTRGVSWTTDMDVARFYAHVWPRRGGFDEPGFVVSTHIGESQAAALFLDRSESEILVPDGVPVGTTFALTHDGGKSVEMRLILAEAGDGKGRFLRAEPVQ